ncbi:cell wall-binding repeat-containing protein [Clostridium ihumii]|uniref:cell wall-binding repeat-containing protein n=1 Tax=Clostridium ihumii TaxID=1470356 RepID=UPI0006867E81|nr:cell wall-binding repeat-containing protein [Clostridium ihumii]
MKILSNNIRKIKKLSALILIFIFMSFSFMPTVTFAMENDIYNFESEILKYDGNYSAEIEALGLQVGETSDLNRYIDENIVSRWLTSDKNIVSVNDKGIAEAKNNGMATIYGISEGVNYVFTLIVKDFNNPITYYSNEVKSDLETLKNGGKYKVFIDPGHGGRDPGAIGPTGLTEKEVVLDVGLRVIRKLEANSNIEVKASRTTDVAIGPDLLSDLGGRTNMANAFGADVFVSIHANSATPAAIGTETYSYIEANDGNVSKNFASKVQNNLIKNLGTVNRGVREADFFVLRESSMPAILAELEFISNPSAEARMKTSEFRQAAANSIYDGIIQHLGVSNTPVTKVTGVNLDKASTVLINGNTQKLVSTVVPSNATNKEVTWTSSNTAVATVDSNGNVKAISEGTAVISVTTKDGGFVAKSNVKVMDPISGNRIHGLTRYETAYEISKKGWKDNEGKYVVLASGEDYPDALCAVPLATKYNAPILLTRKDTLDTKLVDELKRLGTSKIFIVGGSGVISENIQNQLNKLNITTERIGGINRYETSILVAKHIDHRGVIAVATGEDYPDALSIASIAAGSNMPIILTPKDSMLDETRNYINDEKFHRTYIIGGDGVVSNNVQSQVPNPKRISGLDRYETNQKVVEEFYYDINFKNVYVAVGNNYPDALSVAALAGKNGNAVILANSVSSNTAISDSIGNGYKYIENLSILGSKSIISDEYLNMNGIVVK